MPAPTAEFLATCLRAAWDESALPAATAAAQKGAIDWPAWLQAACEGGVAPLLYPVLRAHGVLPPAIEESLRQAYYATAARNLPLFQELAHVLRRLGQAGIPCILLKGAALACTVYGNVALRPMADLDLLVRVRDREAAVQALQAAGYLPTTEEMWPGFTEAFGHHAHLARPGLPAVTLELHWTLLPPPHLPDPEAEDWFWETARLASCDGLSALALSPEAQILHLCAHLLQHGDLQTPRLLWLHDLAGVLFRYRGEIAWESLLTRAQWLELVLPLRQAMERVARDWGTPVPAEVLEQLRGLSPSRREVRRFRGLTAHRRTAAAGFLAQLAVRRGARHRLAFALGTLFPRPRYMLARYRIPCPLLLPFAYPYRWLSSLRRRTPGTAPGRRNMGKLPADGRPTD